MKKFLDRLNLRALGGGMMASVPILVTLVNSVPVFWMALLFAVGGPILMALTPRKTKDAQHDVKALKKKLERLEKQLGRMPQPGV